MEKRDDDRSLKMIACNPAAELYTGVAAGDVAGRTLDESFPGLRALGIPQAYARVVRTGEPVQLGDVQYGDERVEQGWFSVRAFPLPDDCVGVSFEDITGRKRAEEARGKGKRLYPVCGR